MLVSLKKKLSKFNKDSRGSAIVLVIIALAMVGILAATIMWMSVSNYYMKVTDKGNKQGFYSSETVLEQIKAGLEEDASLAASRSYAYILTKDYTNVSTADRDYEFKNNFKNYLIDIISLSGDRHQYNLSYLIEAVDPSIRPETSSSHATDRVRYITTSSSDGKFHLVYDPSSDIVKIEKLHLEYTDEDAYGNEFVSIIDTDIIISAPDVSFTQTSSLPDVFEYALVADKKLSTDVMSGSNSEVNGSIYAGDEGIGLSSSLKLTDAKHVISKGDVTIGSVNPIDLSLDNTTLEIVGLSTGKTTEFWANDITVGRKGKLVTDNVDTYVADDLTLLGRKSEVKMDNGGTYYGYGKNQNVSKDSSAIAVNGIGSNVDMKGLDKVILLGRDFISIKREVVTPLGISENTVDIPMGESIAVRGEQIAFLVPDECLEYARSVSVNEVMPNPFLKTVYPDPGKDKITADYTKSKYKDLIENAGHPEPIYPPGSDLGYVYMTLTGDEANKYYREYYKDHKEKLDNYFMVYSGGKIEIPAGTAVNSEGSIISTLRDNTGVVSSNVIENTHSQLNIAYPTTSEEMNTLNAECVKTKSNLCAKLIKEGAIQAELDKTLFDNLIRRTDVEEMFAETIPGEANEKVIEFSDTYNGNTYKAVFVKEKPGHTYDYDDTSIRVLVVIGDVEVNEDFTGLLISSGKVNIKKADAKITSIAKASDEDMQGLKVSLQKDRLVKMKNKVTHMPEEVEMRALEFFVDGSEYDLNGLRETSESTVSSNKVEFTEMITFSNWVKR